MAIHQNGFTSGYSEVNGIKMYYQVHGEGKPLVLVHGGGSTIETSFKLIIPQLAKEYKVIAMDLQNHGRSGFRDVPETFEQDADDVVALLKNLSITKASFFGFSNGGSTAMQIAIRHPEMVDKLIAAAAGFKRSGFISGFFKSMPNSTLADMPRQLHKDFLAVNPDSSKLQMMFEKDRDRMANFKDWPDDMVKSIKAHTLIINGDQDVITIEHSVEIFHMIEGSRLCIFPGQHGQYLEEAIDSGNEKIPLALPVIKEFLEKS